MNGKWDGKLVTSTSGGPIIEMTLGEYLAHKDAEIEKLKEELARLREENSILRASLKIDFEAALKRAEGDR